MKKFLIVIERTDSGYSSYVPDLPGCIATGKTKEEVENNIYEAIQFHIEGLFENGLQVPISSSESEVMVFN